MNIRPIITNMAKEPAMSRQRGQLAGNSGKNRTGAGSRGARLRPAGEFVSTNLAKLQHHGFFALGVPADLGGGGLDFKGMCEMLRALGRYDGSTALTLSMHSHQVMVTEWKRRVMGAPIRRFAQARGAGRFAACFQRRIRLASRIGPRGKGGRRLQDIRTQSVFIRLAGRRSVDDERDYARLHKGTASHSFPAADESSGCDGSFELGHDGNARYGFT